MAGIDLVDQMISTKTFLDFKITTAEYFHQKKSVTCLENNLIMPRTRNLSY